MERMSEHTGLISSYQLLSTAACTHTGRKMKGSHSRAADLCPFVPRHSLSQVTSFMQLGMLCLYVTSSYSTWIFCRRVSGFATDCPCDVWCRGLTTCLLHVGPPFGNRFLNTRWAVGLTYWIVYLHFFVFWHMQLYMSWCIISFFGFIFTSYLFFIFSSTPVLISSIDVVFVLSICMNNIYIHIFTYIYIFIYIPI